MFLFVPIQKGKLTQKVFYFQHWGRENKLLLVISENKKEVDLAFAAPVNFCRDEATRTPDPYVPNVVRYQLRYIPSTRFF